MILVEEAGTGTVYFIDEEPVFDPRNGWSVAAPECHALYYMLTHEDEVFWHRAMCVGGRLRWNPHGDIRQWSPECGLWNIELLTGEDAA